MALVLIKINQCRSVEYEGSLVSHELDDPSGLKYGLKVGSGSFVVDSKSSSPSVQGSFSMLEQKTEFDDLLTISTNIGTIGVDIDHSLDNYKLMSKAQVVRGEVSLGPVALNTGVTFDTGFTYGKYGGGVYYLGTGFTLGKKTDISTPIGGFSIDFGKIFGSIFG